MYFYILKALISSLQGIHSSELAQRELGGATHLRSYKQYLYIVYMHHNEIIAKNTYFFDVQKERQKQKQIKIFFFLFVVTKEKKRAKLHFCTSPGFGTRC